MSEVESKMNSAVLHFEKELSTLRTSRANPSMLDNIFVDAYGTKTPLNQLGNISIQDASTITIQIWDTSLIKVIESSITESNLGINPQTDGQLIRLPIPELNEERRTELKKLIKSMGEKCKISIRNIRRDANDELKKLLKDKEISEDEVKKKEKIIQDYTDSQIKVIDDRVSAKENEIMTI